MAEIENTAVEGEPQEKVFEQPFSELVQVTPSLAKEWLDRNVKNRGQRSKAVAAYGRDINGGDWVVTGETIKFDWFGNLIDGQHRLEAVVATQRSIQTFVVYGVPPKAQDRIDSGVPRSFRDQLQLAEVKYASTLSALCRRIFLWEPPHNERVDFSKAKVTHADLERTMAAHPEVFECAEFVEPLANKVGVARSRLAFVYWVFRQIDQELGQEFVTKLASGANLADGDPILALRERIRREGSGSKARNYESMLVWLSVYAWNHWMDGRAVAKLQLPPGGMKSENFPRIKMIKRDRFESNADQF